MAYVREVEQLLDHGLSIEQVRKLYEIIARHIDNDMGTPDTEKLRGNVADMRKNERAEFHALIDDACREFTRKYADLSDSLPELNWRTVKVEPQRLKHCAVCYDLFYDINRNGRTLTCDHKGVYKRWDFKNRRFVYRTKNGKKLSVCAAEWERRRNEKEPPDFYLEDKSSYRERLTNFQPETEKEEKFLRYVESKGKKL